MWSSNAPGTAIYAGNDFELSVDATSARPGIHLQYPAGLGLWVQPIDGEPFPMIGEQFVCDDQFHAQFPQGDAAYAVRFACDRIESDAPVQVFELRLSIQTVRMEGEPALDLVIDDAKPATDQAAGESGPSVTYSDLPGVAWVLENDGHQLAMLLCTEDLAAVETLAPNQERCFGQFLEKGVIRRIRPWLVYAPPGVSLPLADLRQSLEDSPIPLSA